jgi:putative lipoic acid-binding regulatory protein
MQNLEGEAYEFPGAFEISAMGAADAGIADVLPVLIEAAGAQVLAGTLRTRSSSGGNYVAVHLNFLAADRGQLDAVYEAVREHPAIKWIL